MSEERTNHLQSAPLWIALLAICLIAAQPRAEDWRQYNGPMGDRSTSETIGEIDWSRNPPAPIWKTPTTNGFSSFTKAGNKVFTLVSRTDGAIKKEFCIALDAGTGAELWAFPMEQASYESGGDTAGGGDGPRSTPSCDGERVYVYDARMILYCLNAGNGSQIWKRNIVTEYGGRTISWQSAASPLLEGELMIVPGGGLSGKAALAFDRTDGRLVWMSLSDKMTHATPVAATIQGIRQIIFFMQPGLVAVSATDGAELWRYSFSMQTSSAASPVVYENYVYVSAAYNKGAAVCRIDRNGDQLQAVQVWRKSGELMNHWSTPVCHNGYIYGLYGYRDYDDASLKCVDLLTGAEKWSASGFGQGGLIRVGDKLIVLAADGRIVVVQTTPAAYTEIARVQMLNGKCWSTPTLSNNRIYARSAAEGVCFEFSNLSEPPPSEPARVRFFDLDYR